MTLSGSFCAAHYIVYSYKDDCRHDALSWMYANDKYAAPLLYLVAQLSIGAFYDGLFEEDVLRRGGNSETHLFRAQIMRRNIANRAIFFLLRMGKVFAACMIFIFEVEFREPQRTIHAFYLVGVLLVLHGIFLVVAEVKREEGASRERVWAFVVTELAMFSGVGAIFLLLQQLHVTVKPEIDAPLDKNYVANVLSFVCETTVLAITIK